MRIILACIVTASITTTCLQASLVGYWPGDGNANDIVSGNNGTLAPGAGFGTGVFGQAFDFDGNTGFVSIPTSSLYDFGTGDFSVAFWVEFRDSVSASNGIISKDTFDGFGSPYNGWLFNRWDLMGGVGMEVRNVPTVDTNSRYDTFSTNQWYHIAGVRSANTLSLYVDGVLRSTVAEATPADVTNSADLRIGALTPASPQNLGGLVDDVRLYNNALSASEVQALASVPEPSPALLLLSGSLLLMRRRSLRTNDRNA